MSEFRTPSSLGTFIKLYWDHRERIHKNLLSKPQLPNPHIWKLSRAQSGKLATALQQALSLFSSKRKWRKVALLPSFPFSILLGLGQSRPEPDSSQSGEKKLVVLPFGESKEPSLF